ncbi:MAG: glycosyltransferase [Cyclobacteriaceae bacterium]|nr:glycosyltransferase [Cyclobacteriaceae bacterium]
MTELPLVSIVTPSYNQGHFLERTILSVLNQDYPNIEYIIMDGGSTDNSIEIIRKYENRLAYWESQKDRGQSHAINKGWHRACGMYCSYLNSDDTLAPGAVGKIVDAFLQNPNITMVYGDYTFIDEKDNVLREGKGESTNFRKLLIHGQMPAIAQPSSFYLTSEVKSAGYLDEQYHLSMDYDLLLKLAKSSEILYVPELISFFRLHRQTKSSTLMMKHWHETLGIKAKYNKLLMIKSIFLYLRFRIFHLTPYFFQRFLRKKRNSLNDLIFLKDDLLSD